ncbi:MAG: hypothetical protein JW699_05270 [Chitinispirillaceae bacterium]|nr:hypothetical protein [Chitinispirillaceae bacterium]
MKKSAAPVICIALSVLLSAAFKCDNGNDPADDVKKVLTLLAPTGGAGYSCAVGDTVPISWRVDNSIPDSTKVSSVAIMYSTDGGTSFPYSIVDSGSVSVPIDTPVYTGSYPWAVGNQHVSPQFVIKVYDYQESLRSDKSAPFVVASQR